MKSYIVNYESPNNIFKGELCIFATDHKDAMSKAFDWVKTKEVWNHLWKINFAIREIDMDLINAFPFTKQK
jgi:hypothetical protein